MNAPRLAPRFVLFATIALAGAALDLWSKSWIFAKLGPPGGPTWWLIEDYFGWQTSLNEGALFGIGQGQVFLFAGLSIVAAIAIPIWLFVFQGAVDRWLTLALALVMAGILGNLYDRLGLWWSEEFFPLPRYAVRDWILWQYPGYPPWPNFNLADSYLVIGAAMIFLDAIFPQKGQQNR